MYYILYLEYIRGMTQVSLHPEGHFRHSVCNVIVHAIYNDELYLEVSWGVTYATALDPKVTILALCTWSMAGHDPGHTGPQGHSSWSGCALWRL
jgi:hypothetical protein